MVWAGVGGGDQKELRKPALEGSEGEEEDDLVMKARRRRQQSLSRRRERETKGGLYKRSRDVVRELARAQPAPSLRVFTHLSSVITRDPVEQPPPRTPDRTQDRAR